MNQEKYNHSVFMKANDAFSNAILTLPLACQGKEAEPRIDGLILPTSENSKGRARVICNLCGKP